MYLNFNELGECIVFTPHVNTMNAKGQRVRIFDNLDSDSIKNQTKKEIHDCPICLETIEKNNYIRTECGHTFHASCLMRHTATNGYTCPCCRSDMVDKEVFNSDEDEDEDEDETIYDDDDDDDDDDDSLDFQDDGRAFVPDISSDVNTQNFRWLFQRANGEDTEEDTDNTKNTVMREYEDHREIEIIRQENKEQLDKIMAFVTKSSITFQDIVYAFIGRDVRDCRYNILAENSYFKVSNILNRIAEETMTT